MYSKCSNWMDAIKNDAPLDDDIVWSQWEIGSQPVESKKGKIKDLVKMLKLKNEGTVKETPSDLGDKMPSFLENLSIKRKQHQVFEDRISQLGPDFIIKNGRTYNLNLNINTSVTIHWHGVKQSIRLGNLT